MDTLLTNVGKILDKSIKFTMFCVRVVGRNNRGFSRVLSGFYCLFIASLSSKKGIKSPVLKHQKRNKIGMLEGEKCTKMYEKKPCFQSFFRSIKWSICELCHLFFSLEMKGKCKTSLGVIMKNLLKRVTFLRGYASQRAEQKVFFLFTFFIFLGGISLYLSERSMWTFLSYLSFHHSHLIIRFSFCQVFLTRNFKNFLNFFSLFFSLL